MKSFDLATLASALGARLSGDPAARVRQLETPGEAGEGDLVVAAEKRHLPEMASCRATAFVVPEAKEAELAAPGRNLLLVGDPRAALRTLLELFGPERAELSGIAPGAHVDASALVGKGAWIGPGAVVSAGATLGERSRVHPLAVIGAGVEIGEECEIFPGAVLYPGVRLGARVRVHAGAVVGADGFGYERDASGVQHKVPQIGTVTIGDDSEIGALAAIDRATIGATRIGARTKIDNLVQVGHNVQVGDDACLVAQAGVGGSARLGRFSVLAGQAGIADHAVLADGTVVGAKSGVHGDLPGGTWLGSPVMPVREARRVFPLIARLPETARRVRELEERVALLERTLAERDRDPSPAPAPGKEPGA